MNPNPMPAVDYSFLNLFIPARSYEIRQQMKYSRWHNLVVQPFVFRLLTFDYCSLIATEMLTDTQLGA